MRVSVLFADITFTPLVTQWESYTPAEDLEKEIMHSFVWEYFYLDFIWL